MADDGISENHGLINSSDIYKDVHMELITTEITNSYDKTSTMEEVGGVVDMSGALNATAALSASAALKLNESNRKTDSEQTIGKITGITTNNSGFSEFVDPVKKENINAQNKNVGSDYINRSNASAGVLHGESTTMVRPLKPEAFIDGIEKFVNFVSKEGLTRKKSDNETPVEQSAMNTSLSKSTNQTVFKTSTNTETKLVDSEREIKNKDIKNRTGDADDVDADLKSYALAVNDMLESEVEIAADGNELDAEIKTMVVSNDDTGEVKMTLTDSAVGRFETIGKNDDAASTIADGLSPLRKSQRAKKRKIYQDFDQADIILSVELENVVDEVSKAIEEDEEVKKTSVGTKQKSKRKNPSPKKAKLTVDEVYESDSNEESDGDINKDILKVRMAKCDVCDKHFLDRKKLEEHKRRHKKKPVSQADYPCVVCCKVFLKREHWRRHVKIHDDVRPYVCPVCKKGFRRKEHVKRHMLIHTGEKPFECMFCSQRYQRADHLKKHLHQHTKDDYQVKQRKGEGTKKSKDKRRKPTAKAAKLVARSRVVKEEIDYDVTEEDEHYSDGLSDDDNLTTNDGLELSLNNSE
jgi:hypothetical protein